MFITQKNTWAQSVPINQSESRVPEGRAIICRKSGLYSQHFTLNSRNSAVLWLMKCTGHILLSWLTGDHWWPNFYTDTSSSISNWRGTDRFETPEVYSLCLFPWLICYKKVKVMASQCPSNKRTHYYSLSLSLSPSTAPPFASQFFCSWTERTGYWKWNDWLHWPSSVDKSHNSNHNTRFNFILSFNHYLNTNPNDILNGSRES